MLPGGVPKNYLGKQELPKPLPPARDPIVQKPLEQPSLEHAASNGAPWGLGKGGPSGNINSSQPQEYTEPESYIRYGPANGPMQEYAPGPKLSEAAQEEAYNRYLENSFGIEEVARREKAKGLAQAYRSGNLNPTANNGRANGPVGGTGYARALLDANDNVIGYIDKQGGQHRYDESMGRAKGVGYEERKSAVDRQTAGARIARLRELATKHPEALGFWESKPGQIKRTGIVSPLVGNIDPEIAEMYSITEDISNAKIYDQSGKAITAEEFKRLKPTMPRYDTDPVQFWANLDRFEQELAQKGYSLDPGGVGSRVSQEQSPNPPQGSTRKTKNGNTYEILD